MSESIPVVLKRRTECPMCQNDWHVTESLRAERDTARGEAEDFRRAWAILREDENQRMPATAEEGARQFRAEFDAVRAELSEANASLIRASETAYGDAVRLGSLEDECDELKADLEKARAEVEMGIKTAEWRGAAIERLREVLKAEMDTYENSCLDLDGDPDDDPQVANYLRLKAVLAESVSESASALKTDLEKARAEVARLREGLERAPHHLYCPASYSPSYKFHGPCSCHRAALSETP